MADHDDIDTEMYLRDGAPHATVCKVQLKDGRIGIGVSRFHAGESYEIPPQDVLDARALTDALAHLVKLPPKPEAADPDDLQAQLGQ